MKKIIMRIAILAGVIAIESCNKYLSTIPDNRTVVTTPDQVTQLLTTAYPHDSYYLFAEAMSDNSEDKGNTAATTGDLNGFAINLQAFKWQDVQSILDDSPTKYFYECYRAIATANQALVYCSGADSAKYAAQKGEALLCRAYAHFMLVTFFANAYDPTTASTDPGIPYVTLVISNVFSKFDRKTVKYDYDMIEADILAGMPLIDERIYGSAPKFHFNLQAAHAFASRFYLFKQDYAKVATQSFAVFGGSDPATIIRDVVAQNKLQYANIAANYTKATTTTNLLLQENTSSYANGFYGYKTGYGNNINATLFNAGDNVTGGTYAFVTYGAAPQFYNFPKFVSVSNDNTGVVTAVFSLFSAEEALLNRAEANARLGNFTAAITDLNSWISKNVNSYTTARNVNEAKMMTYYNTTQVDAYIQTVLSFKRVSYMEEGLRWLDILRLKIPVIHTLTDGFNSTLVPKDKRRLLQLPPEAATEGVPLNPR